MANFEISFSWSVITIFMFLHLYNMVDADKVCENVLKLLRPQPGSMVIGANTGTIEPGEMVLKPPMCEPGEHKTAFRHSRETMLELWERATANLGIKAKISVEYDEYEIREREQGVKLNGGWEKENRFFQGNKERRIFFTVEFL